MGIAELHHAGTFGVFDHTAFQSDGAQFVGRTTAWPHGKPPEIPGNLDLALLLGVGTAAAREDRAKIRMLEECGLS
jgi:hypothetical protein